MGRRGCGSASPDSGVNKDFVVDKSPGFTRFLAHSCKFRRPVDIVVLRSATVDRHRSNCLAIGSWRRVVLVDVAASERRRIRSRIAHKRL